MAELTVADAIKFYMDLRDKKAEIENGVKEKLKNISDNLAKVEAWIQQQAEAQGVSSFKTPHGTAFLTTTEFANVADWDGLLAFILQNEAYDMLYRNVNKSAVRAYIDAHNKLPTGVNFGTKISVNVRRPAAD